jgi:peptidoglycan/LPS O-acetylase OafA/YrhL
MLSGGLIAILEEKNKLVLLKNNKYFSIFIVLCTILYFTTNVFDFDSLFISNLVTCLLFSLFIYTISFANHNFEINNKLLNYLGKISYGIYMYHVIALNIVVFIFLKFDVANIPSIITILLINLLTIILTLIISHFSYQYFEKYFLNLKEKYRE